MRNLSRTRMFTACLSLLVGLVALFYAYPAAAQEGHEGHEGPHDHETTKTQSMAKASVLSLSQVYPLDTCIVSGKKLGEMGPSVIKRYGDREVRFCCPECPAKFEADQAPYLKKLDQAIIKQQKPLFPSDVCVVSGDKIGGDMGEPVDYVYNNRYFSLCCKQCIKDLNKDPAKYLAKLDQAVISKQMPSYPLETCVVSGDKLGSMGNPLDLIFAGRLVRLCCEDHLADFLKEPSKYLAKLDEATKAKEKH